MNDVLVLDAGHTPVGRTSWQHAIVWVLKNVVEVLDEYDDRAIRTVSWSVKMPATVRFLEPKHKKRAIKFSRLNVYMRDLGRCQYCGRKTAQDDWELEHVIPRSQGGTTCFENVVVSCCSCNQKKGRRTPEQAGMRLLSIPVKPKKLPHITTFDLVYEPWMPKTWKERLRNAVYWEGALKEG